MGWIDKLLSSLKPDRATAAVRAADAWMRESVEMSKLLAEDRADLTKLQVKLNELSERLAGDMRSAEQLQSQYDMTVESLRNENKVLADTVIPTLVAGHQLIMKRYEAEAAVQVRQLVAASGRRDEE